MNESSSESDSDERIDDIREEILSYLETYKSDQSKHIEILNYKPKYNAEYYDNKVLLEVNDMNAFEPIIEEVSNEDLTDLWIYFKIATSSIATSKNPGRNIRFLVKDENTQKYIGILAIGSDIYQCSVRDKEISWDCDNHGKRIENIINIWCCVGLQPLSYNTNIGKLLCSLCFSKEVIDRYNQKYNINIAAITTFGINGRAVQYECLPFIKFIGYTKGYGTNHMPNYLLQEACDILKSKNIEVSGYNKIKKWKTVMNYLNIPDIKLKHGILRGVYIGYLDGKRSKDFLQGICSDFEISSKLKTIKEIVEWWKIRWGINRILNLKKRDRYKNTMSPEWTYNLFEERKIIPHLELENRSISVSITKEIIENLPQLSASYIAGLMDGDGCILFNRNSTILPQIELSQCDPYVVFALQKQYNCGKIRIVSSKSVNSRQQFKISIFGCRELLICLKNYCIIKQRRAEICYKLFEELSGKYTVESIKELFNKYENAIILYEPDNDNIYDTRINDEYVAGLFDAEGCITFKKYEKSNSVTLTITQRSNPIILHKINQYYKINATVTVQRFNLYSYEKCEQFLNHIEKYVLLKKDQINTFREVLEYRKKHKKYDCEKFYQLKRKIYIPDDYLINYANMKYITKKKTEQRDLKPLYEAGILIARKNYVRTLPYVDNIDHRVNIAIATIMKRRKITDEIIYIVRKKIENKITQKAICEEMGLSRHIVNNIARYKLLPLDSDRNMVKDKIIAKKQTKEKRITMTSEETKKYDIESVAISKRAYNVATAIQILKYAIEKREYITQTLLSNKSEELFGVKLSVTQIQSLLLGRVSIYEREFRDNEIRYDDYKSLCEEVSKINFKANGRKYASISQRSVDGETIIKVLKNKNNLTHKEIAANIGIKEEQVRGILRGTTRMMPFEFPCGEISWEEYNLLMRF